MVRTSVTAYSTLPVSMFRQTISIIDSSVLRELEAARGLFDRRGRTSWWERHPRRREYGSARGDRSLGNECIRKPDNARRRGVEDPEDVVPDRVHRCSSSRSSPPPQIYRGGTVVEP